VRDNTFEGNAGVAARLALTGGPLTGNTGNTFVGNKYDGFWLSGWVSGDNRPEVLGGLPYVISGQFGVGITGTLTLDPGIVLKFADANSGMSIGGDLVARGTEEAPVVLTSLDDDSFGGDTKRDGAFGSPAAGDWQAIALTNTGEVWLEHAVVLYGGYGGPTYGGWYGARALVDNEGGSARVVSSTIAFSANSGVYNSASGSAIVTQSNVYSNATFGVYNANTAIIVDARDTWWGDASGPAPYGSGNGINYRNCTAMEGFAEYICQYYVSVVPWRTAPWPCFSASAAAFR
jgi:hypothetical protein